MSALDRITNTVGLVATMRRAGLRAAHPEVTEASVMGVDDEQYGQRLAAFVVLAPGASATPDTRKQHVRTSLANYKVPRELLVLDELPRSSTGKILRNDLKARVGAHG